MKKFATIILTILFLFGNALIVYAEDETIKTNHIEFDDSFTVQDALERVYDEPLKEGEDFITKETLLKGLKYADEMSKTSNDSKTDNGNSAKASGYETWTITGTETLRAYGVIKGNYKGKKAVGESSGSTPFSFTVNGTIFGIELSAGTTFNTSSTWSGPSGTELVKSGVYATHRYYSQVGSGTITKFTYTVTDKYTGEYLRTETRTYITNETSNVYGNLGNLNASTGQLVVRSATSSSYKTLSESSWIGYVNSTSVWSYVGF